MRVRDAQGKPVTDAMVMLAVDMDRGSAMTSKADFPFEVAEAGPNWGILLGFGALFALVIAAAVLLRNRKPKPAPGSAA